MALFTLFTKVHTAKIRPGMMDGANGKIFVIKPEERACKGMFIRNGGIKKNIPLVLVNDYDLHYSGNQVLDTVFKGTDPFHDTKNITHIATAITTPVTGGGEGI